MSARWAIVALGVAIGVWRLGDALQAGRRVVVDVGNGEDPLVAREIQLGTALTAGTFGNGH